MSNELENECEFLIPERCKLKKYLDLVLVSYIELDSLHDVNETLFPKENFLLFIRSTGTNVFYKHSFTNIYLHTNEKIRWYVNLI